MEDAGSAQARWELQLARIWEQRRPRILERVDVLAALSTSPTPSAGEIEAGRVEAHKLRGLLGTIGLPAGSEAAGEIEDKLSNGDLEIAEPLARLNELVREHEP